MRRAKWADGAVGGASGSLSQRDRVVVAPAGRVACPVLVALSVLHYATALLLDTFVGVVGGHALARAGQSVKRSVQDVYGSNSTYDTAQWRATVDERGCTGTLLGVLLAVWDGVGAGMYRVLGCTWWSPDPSSVDAGTDGVENKSGGAHPGQSGRGTGRRRRLTKTAGRVPCWPL